MTKTLKLKPIPKALQVLRAIRALDKGEDDMWREGINQKVRGIVQKTTKLSNN